MRSNCALLLALAMVACAAPIKSSRGEPKQAGNVQISVSSTSAEVPGGFAAGNQPLSDVSNFVVTLPDGKELKAVDGKCSAKSYQTTSGTTCHFDDPQLKVGLDVFWVVINPKIGRMRMEVDYNGQHITALKGGGGQKDDMAPQCSTNSHNAPFKGSSSLTCEVQTPASAAALALVMAFEAAKEHIEDATTR